MQTLLFWASKLVNPLLSPLTLAILVPAWALAYFRRLQGKRTPANRANRRAAALGLAFLGALYLGSLPAVSNLLVRAWETERTDPAAIAGNPNAPFDSIIVLGGFSSVELSEGWHIETGQTMERITAAARLYRELSASSPELRIIVTGGSGNPARQDRSESPLALRLLSLMGVPEGAVLLEGQSRNTYENGVFTKAVMEREGLRSAILVTSALHMRRSRGIFEKLGCRCMPFTVDTSLCVVPPPNNLFPDTVALDNTYRTFREIIGFAVYRALGRL